MMAENVGYLTYLHQLHIRTVTNCFTVVIILLAQQPWARMIANDSHLHLRVHYSPLCARCQEIKSHFSSILWNCAQLDNYGC